MIFEGDVILFVSAFLIQQGILHAVPVIAAVLWGMILGDNLWYTLGLKFRNYYPSLNKWAEKLAAPLDEKLKIRLFRTVFVSKFTYGLRSAIFFRAGTLRIKWAKIEPADILATLVWMLVIGSLGYLAGASFTPFKSYLRYGEIALLLGLIIFFALEHLIVKKSKGKL